MHRLNYEQCIIITTDGSLIQKSAFEKGADSQVTYAASEYAYDHHSFKWSIYIVLKGIHLSGSAIFLQFMRTFLCYILVMIAIAFWSESSCWLFARILSQIQPFVDTFAHSKYSDQYCGFVLAFLWQFTPLCMEKWNELNCVSYLVHNRMVELCARWFVDYRTCAFVCHNVSIRIFVCWVRFALCVNLKYCWSIHRRVLLSFYVPTETYRKKYLRADSNVHCSFAIW